MENIPEHPVIRNCEIYGYPDGQEEKVYVCPVCSKEAENFYVNKFDVADVLGCNKCIKVIDSWEINL